MKIKPVTEINIYPNKRIWTYYSSFLGGGMLILGLFVVVSGRNLENEFLINEDLLYAVLSSLLGLYFLLSAFMKKCILSHDYVKLTGVIFDKTIYFSDIHRIVLVIHQKNIILVTKKKKMHIDQTFEDIDEIVNLVLKRIGDDVEVATG